MFRFKFSLLSHGVALAALILLTQACTTGIDPNAKPVDSYGHLQIANGKLTSEKTGSPVQLTGMSLYWSNWGSAWWNESAVDQAVDYLGCKILRAPMAVGQHENGVPVDAKGGYLSDPVANKARLKRVVDQAIYRGIYVIIDWHDHAA